jgi:hypothetical protein
MNLLQITDGGQRQEARWKQPVSNQSFLGFLRYVFSSITLLYTIFVKIRIIFSQQEMLNTTRHSPTYKWIKS